MASIPPDDNSNITQQERLPSNSNSNQHLQINSGEKNNTNINDLIRNRKESSSSLRTTNTNYATTEGGGGNSVYDSAVEGSQTTFTRSRSELGHFTDAHEGESTDGGHSGRTSRADHSINEVTRGVEEDNTETPTQSKFLPLPSTTTTTITSPPISNSIASSALPLTQALPTQTITASPVESNINTNSSEETENEKVGTSSSIGSDEKTVSNNGGNGNGNGKGRDEDRETKLDLEEAPDMAHLNEYQRKIVEEQVKVIKGEPVTFTQLFRFTTRFEIFLNFVGVVAAIVAGAAQPGMTVVFGSLTTAFVDYNTAIIKSEDGTAASLAILDAARNNLYSTVNSDVLILVYIGIAMFIATFLYMATFIYTGESATRRIREAYLRAVLRQNVAYFDKLGAGEVTTRIQTDTHLIQEGISDKIAITVMYLAIFVVGFVVAFIRNWRLALVVSTIVPAIAVAGSLMNKFMSEYRRLMLAETAEAGTLVEEVVSSIRNTHAFGTQKKLAAMYDIRNIKTLMLGLKSARFNGAGMMVFFFIIYAAYALAFYYGTTLILQGKANAGEILNVILAVLIGAFSLAQIAPNMQALSFAMGAATSIFATIDRIPVIDSASSAGISPAQIEGTLQFNAVDFIYPSRPSVQVLTNFTATFPKGKITALVGASGSGKSTLVGLIERFYDPVGGSVELDGENVKDLNVKWLRTQIGLVSQEPTLFATTVAGNIEHGLIGTEFANETPEVKRAKVIEAALLANADGFIRALPEGYDTMIGERGMLLSGGQKQRIAIARAIVSQPQILLLDEATSALDSSSEAIVQDALDKASAGRTTVTIAHRLSTIKDADQIIVLSAGVILESAMTEGTRSAHFELLSRNGAYSRLVGAQKFREKGAEDFTDDDASIEGGEAAPATLTREEVDELARNEKPQIMRRGTDRSTTSEIIARKQQGDLESGSTQKPHSFFYLIYRLLKINQDQKWAYVAGVIASITVGLSYPVFSIVLGGVVGAFSQEGEALRKAGDHYALLAFIIALVSAAGVGVQSYAFNSSSERISRTLRVGTFAAFMRQDIAYFDRDENSTGVVTSAVSDWAQKIQNLLGITSGVIIQSAFTLLAGSIIGLSYAWRVSLVGIACYPFTIAAGVVRLQVVVLKDAKNKKAHEASAQLACEAASAIRTVASLTREDDCCQIYSKYLDEPQRESNRTAIIANAWFSLSQSTTFWVIGLIFYYGAHQLASGAINSTQFFVALISIVFASIQAGQVFTYVPDMSKARGAAADVIALLDSVPEIDASNPVGEEITSLQGAIKFEDVHFRYPSRPHVRVLRGLSLEVKPGQFVAIVGPSGCGKSTLIQLVERFYDPLSGIVKVDGHDISELNIKSYRNQISLVSQEPTLYAGSVRFNITLGATIPAEEVTQEAVEKACRDANIHNFIMSLPDGYDTEVGGKGTQLSGGQKQRVAIARALIRDPKILLLDEATSALDSESEKVVQTALDQAAKGRSTIAVAHRLSTIQGADVIYVLKDGKVAEQGKHFELLAKNGIYAELVSQQSLEQRK